MVKIIMLGEHAEAHLIKGSCLQALHGLRHQPILLMHQRIDRGAEGIEQRAVLIGKMHALRPHHAMAGLIRALAQGLPLLFRDASHLPGIAPRLLRQEPHLVDAVPGVKALHHLLLASAAKCRLQTNVRKRPFRLRSLKTQFKHFILSHISFPPIPVPSLHYGALIGE